MRFRIRTTAILLLLAVLLLSLSTIQIQAASINNAADIACTVPRVLTSTLEGNSRYQESSLGSVVADAVRISLSSDIAVICGGELIGNLLPGEATYGEIRNVFAADRTIAAATITVKELRGILEAGLSHITIDNTEQIDSELSAFDGFPQISGFVLYYDVSAPPGERVSEIIINGESLDLESVTRTITLASTAHMLEGGYGFAPVKAISYSDLTLYDVTLQYIRDGITEYSPSQQRLHEKGANDGGALRYLAGYILPLLVVVFLVAYFSKTRNKNDLERETSPWY